MKRSFRILALCLVMLCVLPQTTGAAAPQTMTLNAEWFEGDTGLYHHGLARASMILATAAYNENTAAVLSSAGFKNIKNHTPAKHLDLTLLNYTTATAEIGGRTVISVVFQDAKSGDQFQSIADFDGRKHGFTAGANSEIAALLASAKASLDSLVGMISENCCIWISGYGYGGGAAELLGAMLNGETFDLGDTPCGYEANADVRCYAFGTPAVRTQADGGDYSNIFVVNNPEDLLVYLPGEQWAYHHFGNVIWIDPYTASSADIQTTVSANYTTYCGEPFHAYKDPSAVTNMVSHIYNKIAWDMDAYYNKPHMVKVSLPLTGSNLLKILLDSGSSSTDARTCYAFISEALALLDSPANSDDLVRMAVGTYLHGKDSPYSDLLTFALEHGLNTTSLPDILELYEQVNSGSIPEMYELICSHTPSCYLAWMMATDRLTELSASAPALEYWTELRKDNGRLYLHASIPEMDNTVWVASYNSNGKMLSVENLNTGLYLNSEKAFAQNAATVKLFLLDSSFCPVE